MVIGIMVPSILAELLVKQAPVKTAAVPAVQVPVSAVEVPVNKVEVAYVEAYRLSAVLRLPKSLSRWESLACFNNSAGFKTTVTVVAKIANMPITINNSNNVKPFLISLLNIIFYI